MIHASSEATMCSRLKGAFVWLSVDGAVLDARQTLDTVFDQGEATSVDILARRSIQSALGDPLRNRLRVVG